MSIETHDTNGVNRAEIPDPREKVWVVIIANMEQRRDGADEDVTVTTLRLRYALSPKGGGPISVYDSKTWGDRSMAVQRANMIADKLNKDRRTVWSPQTLRLGFISGEQLFWSDGEPVDGERVERRSS